MKELAEQEVVHVLNSDTFMLESNAIEGEYRINPGDGEAFAFALKSRIDNLDYILELHHILGRHLDKPWVGRWRTCNVKVGSYFPPKAIEVPEMMRWYIKSYPAWDSYEAHNQFENIHPFRDLNGRVGRLLWLNKAVKEDYDFTIPFLQKYYYQTLSKSRL